MFLPKQNPFLQRKGLVCSDDCEDDEVPSRLLYREELDMSNFVKISEDNTEYVFESERGVKYTFVKEEPKMRAYSSIF